MSHFYADRCTVCGRAIDDPEVVFNPDTRRFECPEQRDEA